MLREPPVGNFLLALRSAAIAMLLLCVVPVSAPAAPRGLGHAEDRHSGPARPDTLLATIGASRAVTARDFANAWKGTGLPSDSLTPESARRFLDLLVNREILAERALAEAWIWTREESAGYSALRDRLVIAAALDSALREMRERLRAAGDTLEDEQALGMTTRDSALASLSVRFDDALVENLARLWAALPRPTADSSAAAQVRLLSMNPRVEPRDSLRTLAWSRAGDYRVGELLDSWRRLSPAYRPRIESAEQVRDLVRNGLYERVLREGAGRRGLARRPDIEAVLARAREQIAIERLIGREVHAAIAPDPAVLKRFFRERRQTWALPPRARVLSLAASGRSEAHRTAVRLRDPAEAESVMVMAGRQGLELTTVWTPADGAVFRSAWQAGTGAVLGPEEREGQWWVTRVLELLPGRERRLGEVRGEVERTWAAAEAERRTRALCERLKRTLAVRIHESALKGARASILQSSPAAMR